MKKTTTKVAAVTLGIALPALALGPVLFPASSDWGEPTGGQVPLLLGVAAAEALALGLAVAFLIYSALRVFRH